MNNECKKLYPNLVNSNDIITIPMKPPTKNYWKNYIKRLNTIAKPLNNIQLQKLLNENLT